MKLMLNALVPAVLVALCSCSSEPTYSPEQTTAISSDTDHFHGGLVLNAISATATVQSVNASTRSLVLQREDGTQINYVCGPDVRNFNRIEVGDKVKVTLTEELAIALVKDANLLPATGRTTVLVRSEPGAKPGGRIVDTVAITARVLAIDTVARTVTLRFPDGHEKKVLVSSDVHLEHINPGDDVSMQLTQALIITVKKP